MNMLELCPGMNLGGQQLFRLLRGGEDRQVFAAIDLSNDRPTVLKIASLGNSYDVARLEREFAVLREASGPGVVETLGHAIDLSKGAAWLVLAAQGPSLSSVLAAAREQRLSPALALAAAHAAAHSLGELHARGWLHGDLKPGNLLCNADGSVLLSDLEFARRQTDRPVTSPADLSLGGTPPFVAPELWREGMLAQSMAADIWALGVTLFLCLFRDYPFGHEGNDAIAKAIQRGLPQQLATLPEPLSSLLIVLMARSPAERPATGREAALLIASTANQLGIDLVAAQQEFARFVASLPAEESPPELGAFAPPTPPGSFAPESAASARANPSAPDAPQPPGAPEPPPPPTVAEPRKKSRPEGIGAASEPVRNYRAFLDIASRAIAPPPQPQPYIKPSSTTRVGPWTPTVGGAASSPAASAAPDTRVKRRAAARWYRRMNPDRSFPLSVVFSGKEIRIVGGSGLGIALGKQEIVLDANDPVLNVEPTFPGCLISPPRADVHVSQDETICRFWITPLVYGDLPEACVTIRYRGRVVETLATPSEVVTRTLARVLAVLGVVSPAATKAVEVVGWKPEELLKRSLPGAANLLVNLGPIGAGLCLAGVLLIASLFYFYITRPLLSDEAEPSLTPQES